MELKEIFNNFDKDNSGEIDADELHEKLKEMGEVVENTQIIEDMIRHHDKDGNGKVDFEEFVTMMDSHINGKEITPHSTTTASPLHQHSMFFVIALLHLTASLYFCTFHQAGSESAVLLLARDMRFRREELTQGSPEPLEIHYLAPCHSFPGHSFLHSYIQDRIVIIRSPECTPIDYRYTHALPSEEIDMKTETRYFERDPQAYYAEKMNLDLGFVDWHPAEYIVTFDAYAGKLDECLADRSRDQRSFSDPDTRQTVCTSARYELLQTLHHAHFPYDMDDPHPKKSVIIYRKIKS